MFIAVHFPAHGQFENFCKSNQEAHTLRWYFFVFFVELCGIQNFAVHGCFCLMDCGLENRGRPPAPTAITVNEGRGRERGLTYGG